MTKYEIKSHERESILLSTHTDTKNQCKPKNSIEDASDPLSVPVGLGGAVFSPSASCLGYLGMISSNPRVAAVVDIPTIFFFEISNEPFTIEDTDEAFIPPLRTAVWIKRRMDMIEGYRRSPFILFSSATKKKLSPIFQNT